MLRRVMFNERTHAGLAERTRHKNGRLAKEPLRVSPSDLEIASLRQIASDEMTAAKGAPDPGIDTERPQDYHRTEIFVPPPAGQLSTASLTPLMVRIEVVVTRLARQHQPMPFFSILALQVQTSGKQSANKAFDRLVRAGRLTLHDRPGERCVGVTATGQATAWAHHSPSHGPFSADPAKRKPAPPARPDYHPDGVTAFRYRTEVQPLVITHPSPTCQFPQWGTGDRPTHRYCGAPSVDGTSWCAECLELVAPTHPVSLALTATRAILAVRTAAI